MFTNLKKNIYKFSYSSNFYYYKDLNLLIDCAQRSDRKKIKEDFKKLNIDPRSIKYLLFTHLHYDHIGNFNLFKNAKLFASKKAIEDLKKSPLDTTLHQKIANIFKKQDLQDIKENKFIKSYFKIINCPGHTRGSISLFDKENKILFSGDTLFYNLVFGRYDLPTSKPDLYEKTFNKIKEIDYKILAPGHNY